jgi:hypothetical protein
MPEPNDFPTMFAGGSAFMVIAIIETTREHLPPVPELHPAR